MLFAEKNLNKNKNVHKYYRDLLNKNVPQTLKDALSPEYGFTEMKWPGNIYHNSFWNRLPWSNGNRKFVGPYGFREAVYDANGDLITAKTNRSLMGTFNFHPGGGGISAFFAHKAADMNPYYTWGN